ncbi:MAG: ABC transporter permease subunit [Desulfovibrionaceae bacterium]|jgi:polar amino acid transport system permease protein|nr:ABC transporter permease subunit [Desulfovibrionaceae bacterium]
MSSGLGKPRSRAYFATWTAAFVLLVLGIVWALGYATQKVDYVWRWYKVPRYFYYQDDVEIHAGIQGTVAAIVQGSDGVTTIIVKGDGEQESYSLPKGTGSRVSKGDFIYPGDVLGSYKDWKVGILLIGLWITLKVSFLAIIAGIVLGLLTGLMRISDNPCFRWLSITYIELIRGSPLLVQIFIWYFVVGTLINSMLGQAGLPLVPPLWFGVASLAFFSGAYIAEIVRAGIQSIHRGQTEAARSLGMNGTQCMVHVILPQAFKRILPPLAGQFISLVKDSSLLGIIAIRELTKVTREVITTSLQPFELWFMCALLYLVLTFALSMLLQYMEKRMINS